MANSFPNLPYILYGSIYITLKNRQIKSMVLEVKIVVTCRGLQLGGGQGKLWVLEWSILDLGAGYMGQVTF